MPTHTVHATNIKSIDTFTEAAKVTEKLMEQAETLLGMVSEQYFDA